MAQFHVSKDPSNQPSIIFVYDLLNIKTYSGHRNDKREIFVLIDNMNSFFLETSRNHLGCGVR